VGTTEDWYLMFDEFFSEADCVVDPMVNSVQTLSEKIRQRRMQMIVHSYLYYVMDTHIVDDDTWQRWADELTALQKTWHDLEMTKKIGFYDDVFADWNGSTGMHLPQEDWVKKRCEKLLIACEKN
jgi:hypothetical protein